MLKLPDERDQVLVAKVREAGQEHVLAHWDGLDPAGQRALLDQLGEVDLRQVARLARLIDEKHAAPTGELSPIPLLEPDAARRSALAERGWEALRAGKVAVLLVAGGQGTRLGWAGPKGTYPVAPVSGKSLFQLFAEQLAATSHQAGVRVPWLIMTSRENRAETEAYFKDRGWFGLPPEQVRFLVQKDLPAVDAGGKMLLAEPGKIATSPNGHGGTLEALRSSGALDDLAAAGCEHLFYFQVDNPLCRVADPVFLGAHLEAGADVSTKVVEKTDPAEKIGLMVQRDGRPAVVEYTEMSPAQQALRDPDGRLTYRAGNTAIHALSLAFLARLASEGFELPWHLAHKAVPFVDAGGQLQQPAAPNAWKFEMFIFDLFPQARSHVALVVDRAEEFEPLKNKSGPYSPETVRQAQSERHRRWLERAGRRVEAEAVEVSPLVALDAEELARKLPELDLRPIGGRLLLEAQSSG